MLPKDRLDLSSRKKINRFQMAIFARARARARTCRQPSGKERYRDVLATNICIAIRLLPSILHMRASVVPRRVFPTMWSHCLGTWYRATSRRWMMETSALNLVSRCFLLTSHTWHYWLFYELNERLIVVYTRYEKSLCRPAVPRITEIKVKRVL